MSVGFLQQSGHSIRSLADREKMYIMRPPELVVLPPF